MIFVQAITPFFTIKKQNWMSKTREWLNKYAHNLEYLTATKWNDVLLLLWNKY